MTDIPGSRPTVVRRAGPADARSAARLHAERISEGFLALLGPAFLELLYRRITRTDGSFLLVAEDGDVVGFVAGSGDVGGLYRSFIRHDGVRAGFGAAGRLLRNWRRVLETLRHGSDDGAGRGRGTELLAIAVDGGAQGAGVGGRLVAAFLEEVDRAGGRAAYVVVASDNLGAIRLYERAGFVRESEFELHAGARSLLLQRDGPGPDRPGG
jgi:ribosomal protein S18 acetylase RimI-like enzyme